MLVSAFSLYGMGRKKENRYKNEQVEKSGLRVAIAHLPHRPSMAGMRGQGTIPWGDPQNPAGFWGISTLRWPMAGARHRCHCGLAILLAPSLFQPLQIWGKPSLSTSWVSLAVTKPRATPSAPSTGCKKTTPKAQFCEKSWHASLPVNE